MCTDLQTMGSVNAQMNPAQLQGTLQNFEMESSKMDMKEEMSKLTIITRQFVLQNYNYANGNCVALLVCTRQI